MKIGETLNRNFKRGFATEWKQADFDYISVWDKGKMGKPKVKHNYKFLYNPRKILKIRSQNCITSCTRFAIHGDSLYVNDGQKSDKNVLLCGNNHKGV